jgi:hypothetical protein
MGRLLYDGEPNSRNLWSCTQSYQWSKLCSVRHVLSIKESVTKKGSIKETVTKRKVLEMKQSHEVSIKVTVAKIFSRN